MTEHKRKLSVQDADPPPPPYSRTNSHNQSNGNNVDLVTAAEALTQLTRTSTPPNQVTLPLISNIASPLSGLSIEEQNAVHAAASAPSSNATTTPSINGDLITTANGDLVHPLVTKVNQVSRHPLFTNAYRYYEDSKRNYPHFNFAAGLVEKAAIPVVNRIELNLNNRHVKQQEEESLDGSKKKRRLNKQDKNETRNRLKFCLHILRLANDNISNKVVFLQDKLENSDCSGRTRAEDDDVHGNVNSNDNDNDNDNDNYNDDSTIVDDEKVTGGHDHKIQYTTTPTPPPASDNQEVAQKTKTEIITTVKKIIHVISNFKTSQLNNPESETNDLVNNELKSTIRDIILKLPSQVQQTAISNSTSAQQANDRVFLFAKDSLDMIGRLTTVFNEQLEKAEDWIGVENTKESQTPDPAHTPNPVDNSVAQESGPTENSAPVHAPQPESTSLSGPSNLNSLHT